MAGNLLLDRMLGAHIHAAEREDYMGVGEKGIFQAVVSKLEAQGRRPYVVPAGGSNGLGTWAYIEAVEELRVQMAANSLPPFDHIVVTLGSLGTALGTSATPAPPLQLPTPAPSPPLTHMPPPFGPISTSLYPNMKPSA